MKKKILILSTAYPLAGTIFDLITASMWLNKYKLKINQNDLFEIDLRLLPNPKVYTLFSFLKFLLSYLIIFFPKIILNFFINFLKKIIDSKFSKDSNLKRLTIILHKLLSQKKKNINKNSFFNSIFRGKKYLISYKKYQMNIELYKFNFLIKNFIFLKSTIKSLKIYLSYFDNFRFQAYNFLSLNYSNVNIGDLVASFTLRANSIKCGGELTGSFALFFNLVRGVYYCELSDYLNLNNYSEVYVVPSEPWYIHQIWLRKLILKKNVKIIDIQNKFEEFRILENLEQLNLNYKAPVPNIYKNSKNVYHEYFQNKLFNPEKTIDTFLEKDFGNDNTNDKIYDLNNIEINILNSKINSIVFTPNFDDAVYDDGYSDKFKDLYEWTIFTIDHCLLNKEIDKVYIKTHPNVDIINYPGNLIVIEKLIKKYSHDKKVIFLNKNSSIVLLSKLAKFYVFTRTGTIAEEMTYLGQPVIAWKKGPWENNYNFLSCWSEKSDFKSLIMNLSQETWSSPTKKQISDLILYVNNYSASNIGLQKKKVRLSLSKNIFNDKNLNHVVYETNISNVDFNSKIFLNIIHYLYDQFLE